MMQYNIYHYCYTSNVLVNPRLLSLQFAKIPGLYWRPGFCWRFCSNKFIICAVAAVLLLRYLEKSFSTYVNIKRLSSNEILKDLLIECYYEVRKIRLKQTKLFLNCRLSVMLQFCSGVVPMGPPLPPNIFKR